MTTIVKKPPTWELAAKQEKEAYVTLNGYCDNNEGDCPARQVSVVVKDFHRELPELLEKGPFCPLCGARLIVDMFLPSVESARAWVVREQLEANRTVNRALRARESGDWGETVADMFDPANDTCPGDEGSHWIVYPRQQEKQ